MIHGLCHDPHLTQAVYNTSSPVIAFGGSYGGRKHPVVGTVSASLNLAYPKI